MIKIKKWRYYCEYCKKAGASAGHIRRHEAACTLNPKRICRMCKITEETPADMADVFKMLSEIPNITNPHLRDDELVINKLRDIVGGCPACMMAALRLYKKEGAPLIALVDGFNYQKEKETFWAPINTKEIEKSERAEYDAINNGE